MYTFIDGRFYFYEKKFDLEFTDPFIGDFSQLMLKFYEQGTVNRYISAIHKFWIYNLFVKPNQNNTQSLRQYLYEYQDVISKTGFRVDETIRDNDAQCKHVIYNFGTCSSAIDFTALEKYFAFILDESVNEKFDLLKNDALDFQIYEKAKDLKKIDIKAKFSHGNSYGLKPRSYSRYALAPTITIFKSLARAKNINRKHDSMPSYLKIKAMPFDFFKALIEVASNDRNRLLYLLCGGTSARLSQALCLTKFDVLADQTGGDEHLICLINPRYNDVPRDKDGKSFREMAGRRDFLAAEYNISFDSAKYRKVGFKYPIPAQNETDRTLFFLPIARLKKRFFDLYFKHCLSLNPCSPFVFQTSSGKLLMPNQAQSALKRDIKKVKEKYPQFRNVEVENFHSLRHMYGQSMAALAFKHKGSTDKTLRSVAEKIEIVTQKKMGHKSFESTLMYFRLDKEILRAIIDVIEKEDATSHEANNFFSKLT